MPSNRLTLADFRLLNDGSLDRDENILDAAFVGCYSELPHAKATHVENANGHHLLFLKSRSSKAQMVFMLRDDEELYNSCAGYDWFPDMAMDYDDFIESLAEAGVEAAFPMAVGYVKLEDADDSLTDALLYTLDLFVKPRTSWFVPHAQMHSSLKGRGFAGILYSRFLNQGTVGFITDSHTAPAAKLWSSVAKHLGTGIIYAERKGKKFSLEDGPEMGRDAVKVLLPKSRFAPSVDTIRSSGLLV